MQIAPTGLIWISFDYFILADPSAPTTCSSCAPVWMVETVDSRKDRRVVVSRVCSECEPVATNSATQQRLKLLVGPLFVRSSIRGGAVAHVSSLAISIGVLRKSASPKIVRMHLTSL